MSESILKTLKEEHERLERYIQQIEKTQDVVRKKELYLQMKELLILHLEGEEKTIYAHLIDDVQDEDAEELALNSVEVHQRIKDILLKIDNIGIESDEWDSTFRRLNTVLIDHIREEEEALFTEAKEDFSKQELLELGDEFEDAKLHISPY